ncbi:MAG: alanyl-tRNA editing protein [Anaerolineales bacterium]|nr:alanyl-tRNA editing protein [Anaerolineales bacterium]
MTLKLYHDDSYLQNFSARVSKLDLENHGLILDRSAFYPGGGGQPNDRGSVNTPSGSIPIHKVKIVNGQIVHFLPPEASLPDIGSSLDFDLDWDYRYQLMRTHTAMHILCGTIFRDYGSSVTGGNMTPLQGRMDFEFASLRKDLVKVIENAVNIEIDNALPISWRSIPRAEAFQIPDLIRTKINLLPENIAEIRIVEIEGLDLQADGGTHVKNTAEVGRVRINDYKSKGRENKRIYLEIL